MTSAIFHVVGKVDVLKEQLIISVNGPRITGNESFRDLALTLSVSLLQYTDFKLKRSSIEKRDKEGTPLQLIWFEVASLAAASAAFLRTDAIFRVDLSFAFP